MLTLIFKSFLCLYLSRRYFNMSSLFCSYRSLLHAVFFLGIYIYTHTHTHIHRTHTYIYTHTDTDTHRDTHRHVCVFVCVCVCVYTVRVPCCISTFLAECESSRILAYMYVCIKRFRKVFPFGCG